MDAADKPLMICHVEKPVNYTLYDCKWIPKTAKFVVLGSQPRGSGTIEIFEVASNDVHSLKLVRMLKILIFWSVFFNFDFNLV